MKIKNALIMLVIFVLVFTTFIFYIPQESEAVTQRNELMGYWFYIKNAYTGYYLDVCNGTAVNGTNVWQYEFNGSISQKWCLVYTQNGECFVGSMVGAPFNGTNYEVKYVLDISDGINTNGRNLQIWSSDSVPAQQFGFTYNNDGSYKISTKCSNHTKVISVEGKSCNPRANVHQWEYTGSDNERWIMEPVDRNVNLGVRYARDNWNKYSKAFPNTSNIGGDCTDFASQCMLASGTHYKDNWYTYRKSANYDAPVNTSQLNNSWILSDPSPWISANEFKKYWYPKVKNCWYCKGQYIIDHPSEIFNLSITTGDVIQIANSSIFSGIDNIDAWHSMFVTGYSNNNGNNTYSLTYHSVNTKDKDLLTIANSYKNYYFIFYDI